MDYHPKDMTYTVCCSRLLLLVCCFRLLLLAPSVVLVASCLVTARQLVALEELAASKRVR